jgi:type I restriction enzyme, S subunit
MNATRLLTEFDRIVEAPDAIPHFRGFILDLALRGKLVEQDPNDESASESLTIEDPLGRRNIAHPFNLPEHWLWERLGAVTQIVMGQSPPGETYNTRGEGMPLINGPVEFTEGPFGRTVVNQYTTAPTSLCEAGDLLLCVRGSTTGRTNIAANQACIGRGVAAIRPILVDRYVHLFIWHQRGSIIAMGRGIAFPSISRRQIEELPIPFPPLAEQHRIVAKVDQLMSLCDRLEAAHAERENRRDHLTTACLQRLSEPSADASASREQACFDLRQLTRITVRPDQIQELRGTILALATGGQLVPQDSGEESASELLKRNGIELDQDQDKQPAGIQLPTGWATTSLGQLAEKVTDGTHKTPTYVDSGVPFVSVKDFSGGSLDFSNTRFISPEEHAVLSKRCDPRRGDILIGRIGTLGKAVLVDTDREFSLFVSVGLIRFSHDVVEPDFFRLLLNSPYAKGEFDRIKIGGATHTNKLNLGDLKTVPIPLPPLDEQHRIVSKVDELLTLCDRLAAQLTTSQTESRRLLEALLHEALGKAA